MAVYAQHGYGKSDKIENGVASGTIQGVVFSARDERPATLGPYLAGLREQAPDTRLILDPQFHLCMYSPAKDRHLTDYPFYQPGRRPADFVGAGRTREHARSTIDFQAELPVDTLIAPTVHVESFEERNYQIALNLAAEAMDHHAGLKREQRQLLASFVIDEQAFAGPAGVDEFLDQVTAWEIGGVYLVVARAEPGYSQAFEAGRLAHVMYASHVLGRLNGLEVLCGYTDLHGALLRCVGATAFASGWSQGCRRYHRASFLQRRPGGRRARLRYCSVPLLNSIFGAELGQADDVGSLDQILSGTNEDHLVTSAPAPESSWDQRASELQHWGALTTMDREITGDTTQDLSWLGRSIEAAISLSAQLQEAGLAFDRTTRGDHLSEWMEAIRLFRDRAGL